MRARVRPLTGVVAALTVVGTMLAAAPAAHAQTYWVPASERVTMHGHGYGHGHGMSQYGAEGAARAGKSYREILRFYYPGAKLGKAGGALRVLLTGDTTSDVVVRPAKGLTVRDLGDGKTWRLPTRRLDARAWRIALVKGDAKSSAVQYRDKRGWHRWKVPGRTTLRGDGQLAAKTPLTLVFPSGATRRYRGALRSASPYRDAPVRDTVNVVTVDQYVRGVLPAEMPASWHVAALRAQAVAARTYAAWSRAQAGDRYWQVCDTTACQVYGGVSSEARRASQAVARTRAMILRAGHKPAFTQFSASSGGWTSAGGPKYLPARKDPFDDWPGNGYHDWTRSHGTDFLEKRYPELGTLRSIKVTRREGKGEWGGRALQVVLGGSKNTVQLSGDDFRWAMGPLPSTWFAVRKTAIQRLWEKLGGARSPYGRSLGREQRTKNRAGVGGVVQRFKGGRMYASAKPGAHALRGPVLAGFQARGGVDGELGFPTSHAKKTGDGRGRRASFQKGLLIWSKPHGDRVLKGAILKAYAKRGYTGGRLGYPTTNIFDVKKGRRAKFQHGKITWYRKSGEVDVDVKG